MGASQVELNHHQVNHLIGYAGSRMIAQLNLSASEIHAAHQCVRLARNPRAVRVARRPDADRGLHTQDTLQRVMMCFLFLYSKLLY